MKITDTAILFVIIAMPLAFLLRIKSDNLENVEYKNLLLNKYLDAAVEDASNAMVVRGMDNSISISRKKHWSLFFKHFTRIST